MKIINEKHHPSSNQQVDKPGSLDSKDLFNLKDVV
jgi:hypothetical protein